MLRGIAQERNERHAGFIGWDLAQSDGYKSPDIGILVGSELKQGIEFALRSQLIELALQCI